MTEIPVTAGNHAPKRRSSAADFVIRLVKEKPLGTLGAIIILIILFAALGANFIAPYDPLQSSLRDKLQPPSVTHPMGTDNLGRDLFSRIIYGARISLYIGLGASVINVIVATLLGLVSGYVGGWIDLLLHRFVDLALSLPSLIILITLVGILGSGWLQITLIMGINGGILWTRVVRSSVISIRENTYVEAAKTIGGNIWHIMRRHILPNIMPVMIIIFSVSIAGNIMAEAGLSFLGLGVPPPTPSWGGMLSADGRRFMYEAWWLAVFPGLILTVVVYGVNMWGDAVRDLLDPRLRGGIGRYGTRIKVKVNKIELIKNHKQE
ncbi:MAG: ABC transporter permease [Dehalococcoidales bacterium]|nr:ABC transporter permease [Dehalococcoidales bacterium]